MRFYRDLAEGQQRVLVGQSDGDDALGFGPDGGGAVLVRDGDRAWVVLHKLNEFR